MNQSTKKLLFFAFLLGQLVTGQIKNDSIVMKFEPCFGKFPLLLSENYISKNRDSIAVFVSKFYISDLELEYADGSFFKESNSYHLIDLSANNSLQLPLTQFEGKVISRIHFHLGINKSLSTSGALPGDLDASKGMYWAWQSGFINFKLEGISKSCKTRNNEFQFHIGGYLDPNYALRSISLHVNSANQFVNVKVDLAEFFNNIDLKNTNSVMIPGKKAMEMADYAKLIFKIE